MRKLVAVLLGFIFLSLYTSAFQSLSFVIRAFDSLQVFAVYVSLFLIIFFISRYLRKRNPKKFLHSKLSYGFVYAILSIAFSFFLLSFVYDSSSVQWQEFISQNIVYVVITGELIQPFFIMFIVFIPLLLVWQFYSRHYGLLINIAVSLIFTAFFIFVTFYVVERAENILEAASVYFELVLNSLIIPSFRFLVGVLPIGWFYELFVETVMPKEIRSKF